MAGVGKSFPDDAGKKLIDSCLWWEKEILSKPNLWKEDPEPFIPSPEAKRFHFVLGELSSIALSRRLLQDQSEYREVWAVAFGPHVDNFMGGVHGGAIATICDASSATVALKACNAPAFVKSLNVAYISPIPIMTVIRLEAWLEEITLSKAKTKTIRVSVKLSDGESAKLYATANAECVENRKYSSSRM